MRTLDFEDVEVRSRNGETLLGPLSLSVEPGTTLALCGATGAGKSLLIELACGTRTPDSGRVLLGGKDVHRIPPARRGIGLLTQDAALYDHLGVRDNLGFGLRSTDPTRVTRAAVIADCLELLQEDPGRTGNLSGGERRRVALAKAIAPDPECLLLDEPLAGLDPVVRQAVRARLAACLGSRDGIGLVSVHEFDDATVLGDRVAILDRGRLLQWGAPRDIIERPAAASVAMRIHRPPGCLVPGRVESGRLVVFEEAIPTSEPPTCDGPVEVFIPAHAARISDQGRGGWMVGAVERTPEGMEILAVPEDSGQAGRDSMLRVHSVDGQEPGPGAPLRLDWTAEKRFIFPGEPS